MEEREGKREGGGGSEGEREKREGGKEGRVYQVTFANLS